MGATFGIVVIKVGPIFDGRARKVLDRACHTAEERIAKLGAATIRAEQHATYRVETPYDRLQNRAEPEPPGWKIHDANTVYGPWLEGTGSRNKTTRFKGYAIYRRNVQKIQRRAEVIADYTIHEAMPGMN